VIAPLAKFIDWSAIQTLSTPIGIKVQLMRRAPANEQRPQSDSRLEEALQFLKAPGYIPPESQPAQVEFTPKETGLDFRFPTPRPGEFAENNTVYGRLYPCGEHWQERPVIILLHGHPNNLKSLFPSIAHRCNQGGFNAVTLAAPYELQRRPHQPGAGSWSGPGYLRMAESVAQAVAEIRALIGWLLGEGCPAVALWGLSRGGWLAGMTICHDARLAAAVLAASGVRLTLTYAEQIAWPRLRKAMMGQRAAHEALNQTLLNLTLAQPVIPKENILLLEGIHDLFVRSENLEELWQAWGRPEIWRLPCGHISFPSGPGFHDRVLCWLTPRLDKPALQQRAN